MHTLRDLPNRGKTHLFLGDPLSAGLDKTVVEPGNAFSPGVWTLGVSLAVRAGDTLIAPECADLPLAFENDLPPVTVSEYGENGAHVRSELCHVGNPEGFGADFFRAHVTGADDAALVIRDIGPAGGPITALTYDAPHNALIVENGPTFHFETPVRVEILPADAQHDSPCALVHFEGAVSVCVSHGYNGRAFPVPEQKGLVLPVAEGFAAARKRWQDALPGRVYAPDTRIETTWQQTAFHMLSAMERGLPRISVANYPIFWIRDGIIVLRALDLMGRADLARMGCEALVPLIFSGGFGSEADTPGEGLWSLGQHALLHRDAAWAKKILPAMEERVEWIERMLTAEAPVYRPADMRTVFAHWKINSDLLCMPHKGNHIHGRMDWHYPDFYINCWACTGLYTAAQTAQLAGDTEKAAAWRAMAERLDAAIVTELLPDFGNERDSCVAPYPCLVPGGDADTLRGYFNAWYDKKRLTPEGERSREPLWTYFEAAQIHNAFLLGERERAWKCLDGFLSDEHWHGMSIYTESSWGKTEMLPFGRHQNARGWLQKGADGANMPHNWTSSEAFLLLRDLFVTEEGDHLALFKGVPRSWIFPGARFGVSQLPTALGTVSFEATVDETKTVHVHFTQGEDIPCKIYLP